MIHINGFGQLQGGGTIPFTYDGMLNDYVSNPTSHPMMSFDPGTARTIAKSGGLSAPVVTLLPRAMTRAFSHGGMVSFFDVFLTKSDGTDLSGGGGSWLGVMSPSHGVKLLVKTGALDTPLPVVFSTKGPKANAASNISVLRVRVPGAINSPLLAPINVRVLKDICLQDDTTPALQIAFNSQNGDYHFCAPGVNLLGRGKLTFANNGAMITLTHNKGDRMVTAVVDLATHTGSASVTLLPAMTHFTITDTNTANNTCTCP